MGKNIDHDSQNAVLFEGIAADILSQGWCVIPDGLPQKMAEALERRIKTLPIEDYKVAGIGRGRQYFNDQEIRRDEIYWIEKDNVQLNTSAELLWLKWLDELRLYLNQRLFLGLFSVESHFAHYPPESFYQKHCDTFKGQANRKLSLVTYLNRGWQESEGGELLIYENIQLENKGNIIQTVLPEYRTLVIFLSEDFPHEVMLAHRDRYSITGWFRVN